MQYIIGNLERNSPFLSTAVLEWSKELPDENGWYWVRRNGFSQPFVYWYECGNEWYVDNHVLIEEIQEWLGPIPEPK